MKLADNTVVHCPTEELANKVLKVAHDAGCTWISGNSLVSYNNYIEYGNKTCYNLHYVAYSSIDYYKKERYKIISAEQFLKDNINLTKQETKVTMKDLKYFQTSILRVNGNKRDITVAVYLRNGCLYGGYAVRNPIDKEFDTDKAKLIATGRAMNERTNILKGESVGSLAHRYILKAIAENLLREIEIGNILIKGIR